ncbi:MAG: hypothetical protein HWE12_13370 [Oceanospirillaceae bacterium]|nr:hypothetical protein [Oceanospirillaceae bacterium]
MKSRSKQRLKSYQRNQSTEVTPALLEAYNLLTPEQELELQMIVLLEYLPGLLLSIKDLNSESGMAEYVEGMARIRAKAARQYIEKLTGTKID